VIMPVLCAAMLVGFLTLWCRRRRRPQASPPPPGSGPAEAELVAMNAAINALPVHPAGEADAERECAVCLASFDEGEEIKRLPCGHPFHSKCIDEWLLRSFTRTAAPPPCPLCKLPVRPRPGRKKAPPKSAAVRRHFATSKALA